MRSRSTGSAGPRLGQIDPVSFHDGRLFKVVKGHTWYFYNDTQDYQMEVKAEFGDGSNIIKMSDTELVRRSNAGACTATMSVFPLETKAMVKVRELKGVYVKYSGIAFTEADRQRLRQKAAAQVSANLAKMRKLSEMNPKITNQNRLLKVARMKSKMYADTSFPPTSQSLIRSQPYLENALALCGRLLMSKGASGGVEAAVSTCG
ncbi:hypothetical protein LSCM1_05366 [Leishmania martiniquensis]|uniref:DUF1935 domain-containing protein n=1 Tax=Leishmania martiniquensis TaxID=1580590 RepID=A0A836H3Q3_9TRYP|nr:hypothetical protein LSCM1_05366 [Leishmania martiniquensis]